MEDEIDLQRYILLLINKWKFILGGGLLLALIVALVNVYVLSPVYQANALVVAIQPRYSLTFDPRFETQSSSQNDIYRSLGSVALSDEVLIKLVDNMSRIDEVFAQQNLETVRASLETGTDNSYNASGIIGLSAKHTDPKIAAEIVNAWAEIFVNKANEIYGSTEAQTTDLLEQLSQAEADRDNTEQALVDFQSQNRLFVLKAEETSLQNKYRQLLIEQGNIGRITLDIDGFITQLATLPANDVVSFENELTLLLLQLKAFNLGASTLQLQVDDQSALTNKTVREIIIYLGDLASNLALKSQEIEGILGPLTTQILEIQGEIQQLEATYARLQQDYLLASETHLTLARKVEETEITTEVSSQTIILASEAVAPQEPIAPKKTMNTIIGGAVGVLLTTLWVLAQDFWLQISEAQDEEAKRTVPSQA